jgi:hypothetical protein
VKFVGADADTPGARHFHRIAIAAGLEVVNTRAQDALVVIPGPNTRHEKRYAAMIETAERRGCEVIALADFENRLRAAALEATRAEIVAQRARKLPAHLVGNALVEELPPPSGPYGFKV